MKLVTVYSQPGCTHCDRVKKQLLDQGVAYEDIDVAARPEQRTKLIEEWGYRQVPVVEFSDGFTLLNPNPRELKEALDDEQTSVFDF